MSHNDIGIGRLIKELVYEYNRFCHQHISDQVNGNLQIYIVGPLYYTYGNIFGPSDTYIRLLVTCMPFVHKITSK